MLTNQLGSPRMNRTASGDKNRERYAAIGRSVRPAMLGVVLILIASSMLSANSGWRRVTEEDAPTDRKIRVYVEESQSWENTGILWGGKDTLGGVSRGGARPQRAEIMRAITHHPACTFLKVTNQRERANYSLLLEHEGGKSVLERDTKVAVFDEEGDLVHAGKSFSLVGAVRGACEQLQKHVDAQVHAEVQGNP